MADFKEAELLERAGRFEEALAAYDAVLRREPGDPGALGRRAWLLFSLARYEQALADYRALPAEGPGGLEARARSVEALYKLGRREEARNESDAIVRELGDDAAALGLWSRLIAAPRMARLPALLKMETEPLHYPGSVAPEVGSFLYYIALLLRPKTTLEIGCCFGYSTLCLAEALEDAGGEGVVHSFDLFPPLPEGYRSPLAGVCASRLAAAEAHAKAGGLAHRIKFHAGDSSAEVARVFPPGAPEIDLAFIDGDHRIRGCFRDWNAVLPRVRAGGVLLLHDTNPARCGWHGPRALLDRLKAGAPRQFQVLEIPTRDGYGMAVIQRIADEPAREERPALSSLLREFLSFRPG